MNIPNKIRLSEQDQTFPYGRRNATEIILLCITAEMSSGKKQRISEILAGRVNWRYFLHLAESHGVASLVYHNLVTNDLTNKVPKYCLEWLSRIYHNTLYKNVIFSDALNKVMCKFRQHRIAIIVLKGTILAEQLYGNPALRTIVDIDILVRSEELSLASFLLSEMGYQRATSNHEYEHHFHEIYCKQAQFPLIIELHWNLENPEFVDVPRQEIWQRAQSQELSEGNIMVLSPEDNLLFLSNHLTKQDDKLLRSLADIGVLLERYKDDLDWDYIVKSTHSWGIDYSVYYSLVKCRDLLKTSVPAHVIKTLKPRAWRRWILYFLINNESFILPIKWYKLRSKRSELIRSLMMKHSRHMLAVLSRSRYLNRKKYIIFITTAIWLMIIFFAALWRNIYNLIFRWM